MSIPVSDESHMALEAFGTDIWIGEGPVVSFYGFPYPTRMVIARLGNGALFVWSPIALSPELKAKVDALGEVRFLIAPNLIHHLFLGEWKEAYPEARMYGAPGLLEKRRDLNFDGELGDAPERGWASELDQVEVRGSVAITEIVFFHRASGSAIFTDLIENFPPDWFEGWRNVVAKLDGIVQPHAGTPRDFRATFFNRKPAKAAFARIADWPIERVIMAHGELITQDGAAFVRRALHWLDSD